jgi:hypothetical protein
MLAVENYKYGGKDGVQEYFSFLGELQRHEEWHAYNPDSPYDTIPIYGQGNNEIASFKLVKAEQYSVKQGEWRYYDSGGRLAKTEYFDHSHLVVPQAENKDTTSTIAAKPKDKPKTAEMLEYERKYSKKKRNQMERDGHTGL